MRTCRLAISGAKRFPAEARGFYEALYGAALVRLSEFIEARLSLDSLRSAALAEEFLFGVLEPDFTRALFGIGQVPEVWADDEFCTGLPVDTVRSMIARH